MICGSTTAMVILHEIYGINDFIREQGQMYYQMGFDVYCPNLLNRTPFLYTQSDVAYQYFREHVGFTIEQTIKPFMQLLQKKYDKVILLGFSAGATIAWRCSEDTPCNGIIACYGSRIRDYLEVSPVCPTLLLFAKHDSFPVLATVQQLQEKANLEVKIFAASHGFFDQYTAHYHQEQAIQAQGWINQFLQKIITS